MKKVIVAGANGFIGKHLVSRLLDGGYEVIALGHRFDEDIVKSCRCVDVAGKSIDVIADELNGIEIYCFYDLAWAGTSGRDRSDYNIQLENVRLTCDYVKLSTAVKCQRFIYASSINEMETYEYLQSGDIKPAGGYIYGTAKLAAHLMAETVAYTYGVEFIPVIITNIYGAGEESGRLIYTSIVKLLRGEHCSFTAGYQTYDFIYITDAINSIVKVAEKGRPFNRYYIGSGEPKALREFLLKMRDIVAPDSPIGLGDIEYNGVDVNYDQFDLKQIEREVGYKNEVSFEEGIKMTSDWIKSRMGGGKI